MVVTRIEQREFTKRNNMEEQVHITIHCDVYHTADFLRKLANEIESSENEETDFETAHGIAEVRVY